MGSCVTNTNSSDTGCVFNIQKFSLHDGPGIRDLIFMKGCPLRCQWCSNPESQKSHPEIACHSERCLGFESCGLCQDECPEKAISRAENDRVKIDRLLCNNCGNCSRVCPDKALELIGRNMGIGEVLNTVSADQGFHFRSGGGVTIGGGDPILQADFVENVLKECREQGIDTAIETAGFGSWDQLEKICRYANLVLFDIKSMNDEKHKQFIGVSNKTILANLTKLADCFPEKPVLVRTPVIPGFNATREDISMIIQFLGSIKTITTYQLMPYHRFGAHKYRYLDKPYLYADAAPPDEELMKTLQTVVSEHLTSGFKSPKENRLALSDITS